MRADSAHVDTGIPRMPPWVRNLLIALFALYVVELLANNALTAAGVGLYTLLAWNPAQLLAWQPLTRFLVQGADVTSVMFSLLMLWFTLPTLENHFSMRQISQAAAASAVGSTILTGTLGLLGVVGGLSLGWGPVALTSIVLIGLALPNITIRVFWVLPIPGRWLVWGTGVVYTLLLLAQWSPRASDYLGAWLGILAWWYGVGPGARRRALVKKGRQIEKELSRFQVLEGGKNRDDVFH